MTRKKKLKIINLLNDDYSIDGIMKRTECTEDEVLDVKYELDAIRNKEDLRGQPGEAIKKIDDNILKEMFYSGKSYLKMANRFGVSETPIRTRINELGLKRPVRKPKVDNNKIIDDNSIMHDTHDDIKSLKYIDTEFDDMQAFKAKNAAIIFKPDEQDPEISAMSTMLSALKDLPKESQERAMQWVYDKLGLNDNGDQN